MSENTIHLGVVCMNGERESFIDFKLIAHSLAYIAIYHTLEHSWHWFLVRGNERINRIVYHSSLFYLNDEIANCTSATE